MRGGGQAWQRKTSPVRFDRDQSWAGAAQHAVTHVEEGGMAARGGSRGCKGSKIKAGGKSDTEGCHGTDQLCIDKHAGTHGVRKGLFALLSLQSRLQISCSLHGNTSWSVTLSPLKTSAQWQSKMQSQ